MTKGKSMFVQLKKDFLGKPAGERIEVADASGEGLIKQGIAELVSPNEAINQLMSKAMEAASVKISESIAQTVEAALKQFQDAQSQARKHGVPAIFGDPGANASRLAYDRDPRHCFGDWLVKVAKACVGRTCDAIQASRDLERDYGTTIAPWQKAAMGESSGVTGGYTVPPDFYTQLLAISAEDNFFRQRAFVQPMGSATLQFPYLDITTVQSAGVSPFFGAVQAYWTAEAQTRTETEPQFKMMELKANELSGYSVSSNVLLQDAAFGLEKFLYTLFGKAVAWYEQFAFLQGNGVGKPLGILNAPATLVQTRNTSNTVKYPDIANIFSKLLPSSINRAVWVITPTVIPQLLQLQDGANRAIFISIDQGAVKPPVWKLLGLPVQITEMMPAMGTKGDVSLVDCSNYVIGDRMSLEIAASEHVNFLKNQMTWRFVQRVDGQPWMDKAVTLQDGTTQVSAFVVLNT
jgi:HK97 family phage major capsid protein